MDQAIRALVSDIADLDVRLATLKKRVMEVAQAQSEVQPTQQQMLTVFRTVGGRRLDPVYPEGTPGTLLCPQTGHVLSIPMVREGEMFIGYCYRVADQATNGQYDKYVATLGSLFMGSEWLFDRFGGFKEDGSNWHFAADRYFNMRAYMTPAERANDDAAKASWNRKWEQG